MAVDRSASTKSNSADEKLNGLLERIHSMTAEVELPPTTPKAAHPRQQRIPKLAADEFIPCEPESFKQAGITDSEVEALVLKLLLARGECNGRDIAGHIKLPFILLEPLFRRMKQDRLVAYRDSAQLGDYVYELTDLGRERGRRHAEICTYFGAAPVALEDYVAGVKAQTIQNQKPSQEDLERAFEDLVISEEMMDRLGPAISSGRGMFLFGFPGNGKTSIAERITKAFGKYIWIPRALGIDGHVMRLFDPMLHFESPLERSAGLLDQSKIDHRWVRIERPTVVVGGELTMEMLEVSLNTSTGISEAPLQMKSNCGTLVIDDLGRQRMSVDELLNRWIVPLEKRYDFLNLSTGKKLEVPFDQLIVFSTNLEPKDLVDDAFLRRIPYKIEIKDPSEAEYRHLFQLMCGQLDMEYTEKAADYLINKHYKPVGRPFRCCQPRDLLLQVRNFCLYKRKKVELRPDYIDYAVENYFAVM